MLIPFVFSNEILWLFIYYSGSTMINYILLRKGSVIKLAYFEIIKIFLFPVLFWSFHLFFIVSSLVTFFWLLYLLKNIDFTRKSDGMNYSIFLDVAISSILVFLFNYIDQYSFSLIYKDQKLFEIVIFLKCLNFMKLGVRKVSEYISDRYDLLSEVLDIFLKWAIIIIIFVSSIFIVNWFIISSIYPTLVIFKNVHFLVMFILTCLSLVYAPVWLRCSISKAISIQRKHDVLQIFAYGLMPLLVMNYGVLGMLIVLFLNLLITVIFYHYNKNIIDDLSFGYLSQ
jgi:hypothetical protein